MLLLFVTFTLSVLSAPSMNWMSSESSRFSTLVVPLGQQHAGGKQRARETRRKSGKTKRLTFRETGNGSATTNEW